MIGKFENSLNVFVRVNNQEQIFAIKPAENICPINLTTRLLDLNLIKHNIANRHKIIVCNSAVRTNCSSVMELGMIENFLLAIRRARPASVKSCSTANPAVSIVFRPNVCSVLPRRHHYKLNCFLLNRFIIF